MKKFIWVAILLCCQVADAQRTVALDGTSELITVSDEPTTPSISIPKWPSNWTKIVVTGGDFKDVLDALRSADRQTVVQIARGRWTYDGTGSNAVSGKTDIALEAKDGVGTVEIVGTWPSRTAEKKPYVRFRGCDGVWIRRIHFSESPGWHVNTFQCTRVRVYECRFTRAFRNSFKWSDAHDVVLWKNEWRNNCWCALKEGGLVDEDWTLYVHPHVLSGWHESDGKWSTNVRIVDCQIIDNEGEGCGPNYTKGLLVSGCIIKDNWLCNVYGHCITDFEFSNNEIGSTFFKPSLAKNNPARNVRLSTEAWGKNPPLFGNERGAFKGNRFVSVDTPRGPSVRSAIVFEQTRQHKGPPGTNSYSDITIQGNMVVGPTREIWYQFKESDATPKNCKLDEEINGPHFTVAQPAGWTRIP